MKNEKRPRGEKERERKRDRLPNKDDRRERRMKKRKRKKRERSSGHRPPTRKSTTQTETTPPAYRTFLLTKQKGRRREIFPPFFSFLCFTNHARLLDKLSTYLPIYLSVCQVSVQNVYTRTRTSSPRCYQSIMHTRIKLS